ncbi:MAG: aminopeptidase P family protein [Rhodobacteraceae bacterium]|nr:aminopeptidase P family protein [Paracoccaceae bacterium]
MPFTQNEIERRQNLIRSNLNEDQAFIAFSFTGAYYLSGAPIVHWGRPAICVVPKSDPAFYVVSAMETPRLASLGHIKDTADYQDYQGPSLDCALDQLVTRLNSMGIKSAMVDGSMAPFSTVQKLNDRCPDMEITDASSVLNSARLILSDEEIAYVRAAVDVSDVGVGTFLEGARIGVAESTLAARSSQAMADFAAQHYPEIETHIRCYSQQGLRTLEPHSGTGGQPLEEGQLLQIVIEASAWHYLSAVERTIALGELPAKHNAYFTTLVEAHEAAIEQVKPGAKCSAPHNAADEIFVRDGFGASPVGTGLQRGVVSEWEGRIPEGDLRPYNDETLKSGMAITVEPFTYVEGVGATRHCDMVLVTDNGRERLSKSPAGWLEISK